MSGSSNSLSAHVDLGALMGSLGVNTLLVPESEVGAGHTDGCKLCRWWLKWRVDMLIQRETGNPTETRIQKQENKELSKKVEASSTVLFLQRGRPYRSQLSITPIIVFIFSRRLKARIFILIVKGP